MGFTPEQEAILIALADVTLAASTTEQTRVESEGIRRTAIADREAVVVALKVKHDDELAAATKPFDDILAALDAAVVIPSP